MTLRISVLLFLHFSTLLACYISATEAENALANERPVLTGEELEDHWNINCKQVLEKLFLRFDMFFSDKNMDKFISKEYISLADNFKKCSYIYNAEGTSRKYDCPNYAAAVKLLPPTSATDINVAQLKLALSEELLACQ